jgi:hypothetical protein
VGFNSLFKVRKPGHGDAVQKKFESAARAKVSISSKDSSQNSGGKQSVGK